MNGPSAPRRSRSAPIRVSSATPTRNSQASRSRPSRRTISASPHRSGAVSAKMPGTRRPGTVYWTSPKGSAGSIAKCRPASSSQERAYWKATERIGPGHRVSTPTGRASPSSGASRMTTRSWRLELIGETARLRAAGTAETLVGDRGTGLVVLGDAVDVGHEPKHLEVPHKDRGAHREVAALEAPDGRAGREHARRHLGDADPAPAPGEPKASAELDSLPLGAREESALRPTHRI